MKMRHLKKLQPGTTQTGPGGHRIWLVQSRYNNLILKSHRTREILDLARGRSIIDYRNKTQVNH